MSETAHNTFEMEATSCINAHYFNGLSDAIVTSMATEDIQKGQWAKYIGYAVDKGVTTESEWAFETDVAEELILEQKRKFDEPIVIFKGGKKEGQVNCSQTFSKNWNNCKSIIATALRYGVSLVDEDGNPKAKTALEKEYGALKDKDEKSAMEKLVTVANTFNALYGQLETDEEREQARKLLAFNIV